MDRVATLTMLVRTCMDCPYIKKYMRFGNPVPVGARCSHSGKDVGTDWGSSPDWCPLPGVVEVEAKDVVLELEYKKAEK